MMQMRFYEHDLSVKIIRILSVLAAISIILITWMPRFFADISDYEGLKKIKQAYLDIDQALELVPMDGVYAVPYAANAAGILYNKDLFQEHGWQIPRNWEELMALCEEIKGEGILPFYFGFKDTWTCLAPWNSMAVDLAPADVAQQVNRSKTTFSKEYRELSEKYLKLIEYGPEDPFAYGYNDACTALAKGESAMYPIGSYAVPQILSVNPQLNIDSFVMPANDLAEKNALNSGIDLQFCVAETCENKKLPMKCLIFCIRMKICRHMPICKMLFRAKKGILNCLQC